jgi:hypothetical protein
MNKEETLGILGSVIQNFELGLFYSKVVSPPHNCVTVVTVVKIVLSQWKLNLRLLTDVSSVTARRFRNRIEILETQI